MYCSVCGAQIPDDSKFCFKCGSSTSLSTKDKNEVATKTNSPYTDRKPAFIQDVGWVFDGKTTKNLLGKTSRGFRLWFKLEDDNHRTTRDSGKLNINVRKWVNLAIAGPHLPEWHTDIIVHKSDFKQSRSDPDWYGFIYTVDQPVLKLDGFYKLEIRFKSDALGGKTLLGVCDRNP